MKLPNIWVLGIPVGMEIKNVLENLFGKTVVEKVLNLEEIMDVQIQEAHRAPGKYDQKTHAFWYITVKLSKVEQNKNR